MEKLFQDEHPVDCIDGVTPVETYGYEATYNGAVRDCIALAEAEAAVVGDWEADFSKLYKTLGYKDELSFEEIPPDIQLKQFITTLLATEREAGAREERESIIRELSDEYHLHMKGGAVQDFIREWQEALTPPTK